MVARGGDRLSDLPDSLLIYILSKLKWYGKQLVRTSLLSKRWRFIWKSVPVSLEYCIPHSEDEKKNLDYLASIHRELHYWRFCEKIQTFHVDLYQMKKGYVKDADLLVLFATTLANVEIFSLEGDYDRYQFPEFAYKSTSLRHLEFNCCELNPFGSVSWTSLQSLSIRDTSLTDGTMEKVLSGCPNLERLELYYVLGFNRLEINSTKLRELIIHDYRDSALEILAPYIQILKLSGFCLMVRLRQSNVPSLISAVLDLIFSDSHHYKKGRKQDLRCLKRFLHSLAHVQNLELGGWCIECLSVLELEGWQCPPSTRKYLKISSTLNQLDFPGICNLLQSSVGSSVGLETLVIDWMWIDYARVDLLSLFTKKDERNRRLEMNNFNVPLLHLKTIQINFHITLSGNTFVLSLVKYFLKNAIVLEKFILVAESKGRDVAQDYAKMEQEILNFPRSSPHASVVFSY